MYQNVCYRGVTYSVPKQSWYKSFYKSHHKPDRAPVILKYRGILYISGSSNFTGAFLKS